MAGQLAQYGGRKGATGPGKGAFHQPGSPQMSPLPMSPNLAPAGAGLAAAAAPAPPSYEQLYAQGLAQATGGVGKQFEMALRDIATRQGNAQQALGMLPGQLGTIYDQSGQSVNAAVGALDSAQAASGLRSYMGAGAQMAPLTAASANDRAAHLASVPVLGLAVQNAFSQQRGEVEQSRAAAEAEVQARHEAQAHDYANMQMQHQYDLENRTHDDRQRGLDRKFQLRQNTSSEARAERNQLRDYEMRRQLAQEDRDASIVDKASGLTSGDLRTSRASKEYQRFMDKVTAGKETSKLNFGKSIFSHFAPGGDFKRYYDVGSRSYKDDEIADMLDKSGLPPSVKNALYYDLVGATTAAQ